MMIICNQNVKFPVSIEKGYRKFFTCVPAFPVVFFLQSGFFPEGGYRFNNKNKVCDFKAGSFKIALKSHAPIVPIALIDSYKVFNSFHIGPITTYVHYLNPISFRIICIWKTLTAVTLLALEYLYLFDQLSTGNNTNFHWFLEILLYSLKIAKLFYNFKKELKLPGRHILNLISLIVVNLKCQAP